MKKFIAGFTVATLFFGGMKIGELTTEKEILVQAETVLQAQPQFEGDTQTEALSTGDGLYNQDDIYGSSETEGIVNMPLKAKMDTHNGIDYFILSDGQGSFYVTMDYLEDGQNYIGFVDPETDKLISWMESEFVFDYESDWKNESYLQMDREVGRRLFGEQFNSFYGNL